MTKKLFFALSLMTALAIGCSKSDKPGNPTTGGDDGGNTPGQTGGIYSETFAGYSGKVDSGYLANESFTSTATGVTWNLDFGKIDQTEDHESFYEGHCFTMGGKSGKADRPVYLVNATGRTGVLVEFEARPSKVECFNVFGEKTGEASVSSDIVRLDVPASGHAKISW